MEDDNVDFGCVETYEGNRCAKTNGDTERRDLGLVSVSSSEINGYKAKPDDTSRVHSEADEFAFVKVFGYLSCFYGINGGYKDQNSVV